MISISVIKVKVEKPKYILHRKDLEQIKELLHSARSATDQAADKRIEEILATPHMLNGKIKYTLSHEAVNLNGENIYIYSTLHQLKPEDVTRMIKLVKCAIQAPNTLLVFPDYIVISDTPPDPAALPKDKKRRKKNDD